MLPVGREMKNHTAYGRIVTILGALLLMMEASFPVNYTAEADHLKAAFIYNFTKYIAWPYGEKFTVFKIGVIGETELVNSLQLLAQKKTIDQRPIEIHVFKNPEDLKYCHILFIAGSEKERLTEIFGRLRNMATLTIGDTPGYCTRGVMINFYLQGDLVKFEMNPLHLERVKLKASSQLQKLARIVQ